MAGREDAERPGTAASAPLDGDAAVVRGDEPPSARAPLSRERIVDAALEFIDDQGLPGLSMRRLGTLLGVEAMALYRYLPGREQLLDAVVDRIVDEMASDPDVPDSPEHGWQDYLQRLAHGIRRVALAHPKAFPLVASRPAEAPWLRPPLRSLRWVESFLQGLRHEGFSDPASRGGVPRVHQLPARSPAARGLRTRCRPRTTRRRRRGRRHVAGAVSDRPTTPGAPTRGPLRDRVRGLPGEPAATARADPHRELKVRRRRGPAWSHLPTARRSASMHDRRRSWRQPGDASRPSRPLSGR